MARAHRPPVHDRPRRRLRRRARRTRDRGGGGDRPRATVGPVDVRCSAGHPERRRRPGAARACRRLRARDRRRTDRQLERSPRVAPVCERRVRAAADAPGGRGGRPSSAPQGTPRDPRGRPRERSRVSRSRLPGRSAARRTRESCDTRSRAAHGCCASEIAASPSSTRTDRCGCWWRATSEAASALLWHALAIADGPTRVRWITGAQQWAIEPLVRARLQLTAYGALCVRGTPGTLQPFVPSVPFA